MLSPVFGSGKKPTLLVRGMHGMGDCLHQRAILRLLMEAYDVILETSWASMYHDLIAAGLRVCRPKTVVTLRTQRKNAQREAHLFTHAPLTASRQLTISYRGAEVLRTDSGTILEVMCKKSGVDFSRADFRLPIPQEWLTRIDARLKPHENSKPLLVYRPLVVRNEWRGGNLRNADPMNYAELLMPWRDQFFVVSVADLVPGVEWIVGPRLKADLTFHAGELPFEELAALFARADLIYCSSGFATILGPAVGTPTLSIIGGYESVGCHMGGARYAPLLSIGPQQPCSCWTSGCGRACSKKLDMVKATEDVRKFVGEIVSSGPEPAVIRPFEDYFDPPAAAVTPIRPPGSLFLRGLKA